MTLLQDPPTGTRHGAAVAGDGGGATSTRPPVPRMCDSLDRALDAVAATPGWALTPGEQAEALVEMRRQQARLKELELRVLVAADRNEVGADTGATSTPAWLAQETRSTRAACFRDLQLAQRLDEDFGATRAALAEGSIDAEKAGIVVAAVDALTDEHDDLPDDVHPHRPPQGHPALPAAPPHGGSPRRLDHETPPHRWRPVHPTDLDR